MAEETKKATVDTVEKENITKAKVKPEDGVYKVDLSKPPNKEVELKEDKTEEEVVVVNEEPKVEQEEVVESKEEKEQPVLQEVTEEELVEEIEEAVTEAESTGKPLPEKIEKLIKFMDETGGDLNDYVNLNRDISKMDDSDILDEYYRSTKPHLSAEERNFMLEENFGYDGEVEDEKTIRRKKIALKEQVAEAKAHLDRQKSKYYEDIKAGSKLTDEQQKAINFFNRYNKETQEQKKRSEASKKKFRQRTEGVFNKDFKGFDYQVGDKKFRFNVKDIEKVKETQSDLNNFVNKFVGKGEDTIEDAAGYHKSLFTAMNADAIAKHFYEQGKADGIKDRIAKDKNINLDPRKTHGETEVGGVKYRVLGETARDFKFKINKKK